MEGIKLVTVSLIFCFLGSSHAQIPNELLKRLKKMSTAEFIDEYLTLQQTEGNNITGAQGQELSSSGRIPPNQRDNLLKNVAQPDFCAPHKVTVPIPQDPDPNVIYFPTCTLIERCSGCVESDAEICAPVDSVYETIVVLVSRYMSGSTNDFGYQRTKNVHILKHLECEPRCKVQPDDCDYLVHQSHDEETCRCICKNAHMESSCVSPKRWDKQLCECVCPFVKNCNSRTYAFNTDTCRCERRSLSSASSLGLHSSANDPSGTMNNRGLDNSTVERLRGLITDYNLPTTDDEVIVLETTTDSTTTTEAPTTTTVTTTQASTTLKTCVDHPCPNYWTPGLLANGECGCTPAFDIFGGGKK